MTTRSSAASAAIASSASAEEAEATLASATQADSALAIAGANTAALITALQENNNSQRTPNDTIQAAFSTLTSHLPTAPMDHDGTLMLSSHQQAGITCLVDASTSRHR